MAQIKYQKLQSKNLAAAKRIYEYLKVHKVIDEKTFAALYFNMSIEAAHQRLPYDGSYGNRVLTTKRFLSDHGLATFQMINGIRTIAATQKCFRTKSFKNATREVQTVLESDIDKAIQYVTLNNNEIPLEYEAPIVANILGLEGHHWDYFVSTYKYGSEVMASHLPIKYKVVGPVQVLYGAGMIKKV